MPQSQLWLSDGNTRIPFLISQIVYCLASNQYCIIHYINTDGITIKTFTAAIGLGILENKLMQHNFIRTGKSELVNLRYVSKFSTKGKGSVNVAIASMEFELSVTAKQNLLSLTKI